MLGRVASWGDRNPHVPSRALAKLGVNDGAANGRPCALGMRSASERPFGRVGPGDEALQNRARGTIRRELCVTETKKELSATGFLLGQAGPR